MRLRSAVEQGQISTPRPTAARSAGRKPSRNRLGQFSLMGACTTHVEIHSIPGRGDRSRVPFSTVIPATRAFGGVRDSHHVFDPPPGDAGGCFESRSRVASAERRRRNGREVGAARALAQTAGAVRGGCISGTFGWHFSTKSAQVARSFLSGRRRKIVIGRRGSDSASHRRVRGRVRASHPTRRRVAVSPYNWPGTCFRVAQVLAGPRVKNSSPGEGRRTGRGRSMAKHVGEVKRGSVAASHAGGVLHFRRSAARRTSDR